MKKLMIISFVLLAFATFANAQSDSTLPKVYVVPMENNFSTFITAALIQRKVPVQVVLTDENADYVITGGSVKGDNKWSDTIFGNEKDRNQGSITVVKTADKTIAWAGSAGDKSFWFPAFKGTGQKKVAERIVDRLKKELFNGKSKK